MDAIIEATHKNGYSGKLIGENEMYIYDLDGKEVYYTPFRNSDIQTQDDLMKQLADFPTFIKLQQGVLN